MTRPLRGSPWPAALLAIALLAVSQAQAQEVAPGEIIAKVTCRADAGQSYALFLPSTYSPRKAWPIVYAKETAFQKILESLRKK